MGATRGRSILGIIQNGKIELRELIRFPDKIICIQDKNYWDIFALYEAMKEGLATAASQDISFDAIGIDTWGVDFVYVGEDGSLLSQPRSYCDPYTNGIAKEYFKLIPKKTVYNYTGTQISFYQLYAAKCKNYPAFNAAEGILFMPDTLLYLLTGKRICEYTIASTSQLLNPKSKKF